MINILKLLLILFILVNIINPLINKINNQKKEIQLLENNIIKYKNYLTYKNKINLYLNKSIQIANYNKNYFFIKESSSQIFTTIQNIIKKNANFNFDYIKWDTIIKKDNFNIYPITIKFSTTPENFGKFIKKICENRKLLIIKNLKINAINKRKIIYTLTIAAYQLKENF